MDPANGVQRGFTGPPLPGTAYKPLDIFPDTDEANQRCERVIRHVPSLITTGIVRRGSTPTTELPRAADLDGLQIPDSDTGKPLGLKTALKETNCTGLLVVKDGFNLLEAYPSWNGHPPLQPGEQRLWYSMSKSLCGCLAGILADRGELNVDQEVLHYLPEINATVFAGVSVRDLLNMRSGILFDEGVGPEWTAYLQARGILPKPSPAFPACQYEYLRDYINERSDEPGKVFNYKEVDMELLAWVLERVSGGSRFYELVSEHIWSKLGCENDAFMIIDGAGCSFAGAGMAATLRDTARYGQMLANGGRAPDGTQVVPSAWLEEILANNTNATFRTITPDSMIGNFMLGLPVDGYINTFWHLDLPTGPATSAIGYRGNVLVICPQKRAAIVHLGANWQYPAERVHKVMTALFNAVLAHI